MAKQMSWPAQGMASGRLFGGLLFAQAWLRRDHQPQ